MLIKDAEKSLTLNIFKQEALKEKNAHHYDLLLNIMSDISNLLVILR